MTLSPVPRLGPAEAEVGASVLGLGFASLATLTAGAAAWSLVGARMAAAGLQGIALLGILGLCGFARRRAAPPKLEAAVTLAYASLLIGLAFDSAPGELLVAGLGLLPLCAAALGGAATARWAGVVFATWIGIAVWSAAGRPAAPPVSVGLVFAAASALLAWGWASEARRRRRQVEDLLSAARDSEREVRAAGEKQSQFVTNMSHEFRTPLAGILGLSELLLEGPLAAEQRKHLYLMQDSTRGLLAMVDDLLDVGRVESGNLRLVERRVDLARLCERTAGFLAPRATAEGLELRCRLDPELPVVSADPVRIRQVLLNLLANAIKFTEQGEVDLIVTWSADASQPTARFEVRDTGIGIPESAMPRLFAPFQQVDSSTSRRFGGSGLGLAICKSLVELMGGEIGARSRRGQGSVFWFELPLTAAEEGEEIEAPQAEDGAGCLEDRRILVVEDDDVNLLVIVAKLESLGVQVETARHGAQALEKLALHRFDLVLMDCQVPGIDGYEATRRLRRGSGPMAQIPVVALTAHTHPDERGRCLAAGMNDYLSKPVETELLQTTLVEWLEEGPAPRRVSQAARLVDGPTP